MRKIKAISIIILFIFASVFILQNAQPVEVVFLFWRGSASNALIIFFSTIVGIIIGIIGFALFTRRRKTASK